VLVFLPGYMSDMQGGKAQALSAWASENGRAMLRLDYSGCGESGGEFADSSFTEWRDEVLWAINHYGCDKVILVGSSMGGWLMLLVGMALGDRLSGLVGIAAAPDFTEWGTTDAQKAELAAKGIIFEDNPYGPEPTPTYLKLWEDGQRHRLLGKQIPLDCPVRLLHGQQDKDVPWKISMQLGEDLRSDDVQIKLIKDGDHRLSRPQDIALLVETVAGLFF
jgi:pimeloyl-ACP methyl ester carboxylesterase